jgi:hypothetical protein
MTLRLRITNVDHYGFNGREHHPTDSDIDLVVSPIKMQSFLCDDDGLWEEDGTEPQLAVAAMNMTVDGMARTKDPELMQAWLCVTDDGRLLDLMDFEVELVSAL